MNRVFKDTESGAVVTMWDLLEEYNDGERETTFGEYVANCQTFKGGTLEEIRDFQIDKGFRVTVRHYGAANYDGYYCRDWRDVGTFDTITGAVQFIENWLK